MPPKVAPFFFCIPGNLEGPIEVQEVSVDVKIPFANASCCDFRAEVMQLSQRNQRRGRMGRSQDASAIRT